MKIVKVEPNWMESYVNSPSLNIYVENLPGRGPRQDPFRYLRYNRPHLNSRYSTLWFAEYDGFVRFYAHNPGDTTGFGGSHFKLTDIYDKVHDIIGPWSSRPGVMNKFFRPLCTNCCFIDADDMDKHMPARFGGHISLKYFIQACEVANVIPLWTLRGGELDFEFTSYKYQNAIKHYNATDSWGYLTAIHTKQFDEVSQLEPTLYMGYSRDLPPELREPWDVPQKFAD